MMSSITRKIPLNAKFLHLNTFKVQPRIARHWQIENIASTRISSKNIFKATANKRRSMEIWNSFDRKRGKKNFYLSRTNWNWKLCVSCVCLSLCESTYTNIYMPPLAEACRRSRFSNNFFMFPLILLLFVRAITLLWCWIYFKEFIKVSIREFT